MANRARVIYQSEALYAGTVDATGYHFLVDGDGYKDQATADAAGTVTTGIQQLHRVQSANYSFSINRQDVNQFGQLARIDSVAIEPPTVSLDFSYYLTNGFNEKTLGFEIGGINSGQALTQELLLGKASGSPSANGKNFFIQTTDEGTDAVNNSGTATKSTIALGNGYVSNYSVEAAVGSMPTASVTIDGLNLRSYTGVADLENPAIDTRYGYPLTGTNKFSLPMAVSGKDNRGPDGGFDSSPSNEASGDAGIACLRPGDISMSLGDNGRAGAFELLPSKDPENDYEGSGSAHVQSFSIDVPISRSAINRLGNPYGYARVTDFPVNISVSVNALVSELKQGSVAELLFNQEEHDLTFTMREPNTTGTGPETLEFTVKGARLEGESFSSSIGDNKSVDLTFTAQVGGPNDDTQGLFISGSAA